MTMKSTMSWVYLNFGTVGWKWVKLKEIRYKTTSGLIKQIKKESSKRFSVAVRAKHENGNWITVEGNRIVLNKD